MTKCVILIGPPGSGKTTYAKELESKGYTRVSGDDQGDAYKKIFKEALLNKKDIVIDRMGFNTEQRDRFRIPAIEAGYKVEAVEFIVPYKVCLDRCLQREGHPTIISSKEAHSALHTYFSKYETVKSSDYSNFQKKKFRAIDYKQDKPYAIMVDLDGTLCDIRHRLKYVKGEGKKNWKAFFEAIPEDEVYWEVERIINLERKHHTEIILCSGRPDDYRTLTETWLLNHVIPYDNLVMRPRHNFKSDDITKLMLYEYEIEPFFEVLYVLDDRQSVVDMWRKNGLRCLQVRPGDF